MHSVFLDIDTLDRGDLDLSPLHNLLPGLRSHPYTSAAQLQARLKDADIVLLNKVPLSAETLAHAPHLRCVCLAATGTDNVDLEAARDRGIAVYNVRDYGSQSVAEHAIGLMLALVRRLHDYRDAVRGGLWSQSPTPFLLDFPIGELAGKRLAIIGYGVLGQAMARLARAFGMEILVAERRGRPPRPGRVAFEEALEAADIVSLHCPLTPETRHLIGAAQIERIGPEGLLINTARGSLVDSLALARALRSGALAGAGLDVLDSEPPPADHPLLAQDLPNLIITPHVAWASRRARQTVVEQMADALAAFLKGRPHPHRVV